MSTLNKNISLEEKYSFGLRSVTLNDFEKELMIYEDNVSIDNRGTGKQIFIKTEFALERANKGIDIVLVEEPENHLSPVKLRSLIQKISKKTDAQIFISTHNNMISTRLELNNILIMHEKNEITPVSLNKLSKETSDYFLKAPTASIIEFALSQKVILVEGPSEYILIDKFYKKITGNSPEKDGVQIIDIRGLSFKRYLEIATLSGSRVAVITDNDHNYEDKCKKRYSTYENYNNIRIFYEQNNDMYTFELVMYNLNKELCNKLFNFNDNNACIEYMKNNKTECALKLLNKVEDVLVPKYIEEAIKWIRS